MLLPPERQIIGVSSCGALLLIGGSERKSGDSVILRRLAHLAGGRRGRLVVCTAASEFPERSYDPYREVFSSGRFPAPAMAPLHLEERRDACRPSALRLLAAATAVLFTGGDQLRLTSLLGGTPAERLVKERWGRGLTIAGTSAGASAVSDTMIVEGASTEAPKMNTIRMAPGLGVLPGVVVDQHFAQRGRIGRLLSALAQNPRSLGLGLDEDTAVEVRGRALTVLGSQTVTVLDASRVTFSNASESAPDRPLCLAGVRLHVLAAGYGFDLASRRPLRPKAGGWLPFNFGQRGNPCGDPGHQGL